MKYSIQETGEKINPYKLYRYDEYVGVPNNAELEFWMRIQELEAALVSMAEDRDSWRERSHEKAQEARLSDYYKSQIARIQEMEKDRDMWKSNHDNQVKLKHQLMDRPDLKDRAASVKRLNARIEELETQNEILIETGHWIGQDEAYDLKVAVQEFLKNSLFAPEDFFKLKEALKACDSINSPPKHTEPPHNHPTQTPPQESESPQTEPNQ